MGPSGVRGIHGAFGNRHHNFPGRRNNVGIYPPGNGHCKFPENPFLKIQPGNPYSWYGEISKFMSGLLGTQACLEAESTAGILGAPGYNPQENIHNRFKVSVLLGMMYDKLKWVVEMAKQLKEALKDTFDLAKPAR